MNREIIDINDYTVLLEGASTDNNLIDSCLFDEPVIAIAFYGAGDVGLKVKFDGKMKELEAAMTPEENKATKEKMDSIMEEKCPILAKEMAM